MVTRGARATLLAAALAWGCCSIPGTCAADAAADAGSAAAPDSAGSSAAPPAAALPAWLGEVSLNGFLESSFSYNFNRPASGTNQFRVFDFDDNTFKVDVFELVAQRPVANRRDAGFRVDLTLGSSIPQVAASAGLFRDATGQAENIDVHQAFVSWIAPAGSGLRLDFGKFITHFGYEVIEGYDGWNDNATRSLLFGFAIPFTHVGLHAVYPLSPRATLVAMVVNGWDVARDNNHSKSVGGQIALTPATGFSLYVNGMWGPERAGNDGDPRTLLDAVATWKAGPRLTLGANGDWGMDQNAVGPGADAQWSGAAGYVRLLVTPSFALIARGETLNDRDGARTGVAQTLSEFTLTPELRLTPHLLARGDARIDRSNHDVFEKSQGFTDSQPTALFGVIYSF
jgi:putative OmpL-like beta-barrel porin-2